MWWEATKIRQEWLGHGLSTEPADRSAAEHHLTAIYARVGRARPEFLWVSSPAEAIPLVADWPTLDQVYAWIRDPYPRGRPPLASDLAMVAAQLRAGLSAGVAHAGPELTAVRKGKSKREPWPERPPVDAIREGVPLGVVLHRGVRVALHRSLAHGIAHPVRDAVAAGAPLPVCWYGQHDAAWVTYYDVLHRLGLAGYGSDEAMHLGHWAGLARSCRWWWPGEGVCSR